MTITQQEQWITEANKLGYLWTHDGNPKRPHVELTSGNHSSGFFNGSGLVHDYPRIGLDMAEWLAHLIKVRYLIKGNAVLDKVFCPAKGAILIAGYVAAHLNTPMGWVDEKGTLLDPRFTFTEGTRVLVIEDTITTGGSLLRTIETLESKGANVLPVIGALCNRSGKADLEGREIIALIDIEMPIWTPEECPLCAQGSEAIRPKGNWGKLTKSY